jgi:hypothetical protein
MFGLHFLVSGLCFVIVNSLEEREEGVVSYPSIAMDQSLSTERTLGEVDRAIRAVAVSTGDTEGDDD